MLYTNTVIKKAHEIDFGDLIIIPHIPGVAPYSKTNQFYVTLFEVSSLDVFYKDDETAKKYEDAPDDAVTPVEDNRYIFYFEYGMAGNGDILGGEIHAAFDEEFEVISDLTEGEKL